MKNQILLRNTVTNKWYQFGGFSENELKWLKGEGREKRTKDRYQCYN
jgi:hypothetical protein